MDVRYVARYPIWALGWGRSRARLARLKQTVGAGGRRQLRRILDAASDRRILRIARDFDVVLLIKVDSVSLVQALRRTTRARLVYDLADARRQEMTANTGLGQMLALVDAVTVDNPRGIEFASRHNRSVHVWPPIAYVERFDARRASSRRNRDGRVVLGWVGTPSTASNLYLLLESLEDVFRNHEGSHLRLVGIPPDHELLGRFEHVNATARLAYDADDMIGEVLDMDIGLFPTYDLENSAMHGATKALIYMAGGAIAACSPVGEVTKLVQDGENGVLATGRAEWTAKLGQLVHDGPLRARLSEAALRSVRTKHSLRSCFDALRPAIGL